MIDNRIPFLGALLTALSLAACAGATTTVPTARPVMDTSESITTATALSPNLSTRPLIYFGPLPHSAGSLDFMNLFREDAPWTETARRVQVFMLYGGWVAHFPWEPLEATDEELSAIIADLNRRGIAIGFEAGPLVATDECGRGIEGFFGPEEGIRIVKKLKELGADVKFVQLDEPYYFGHIYSGPNACQWPVEKIAREVQNYIRAIKGYYPDAIIGDNEALLSDVVPEDMVEWMDTFESVTGSPLPFLHLDLDYSRADWPQAAKQIEDAARARGVEFGIFYFGDPGDASDAQWVGKAFERARVYELIAGGRPDHVVFQSWHDRPDYVLPETDPETFTGLIDLYFRERPQLSLDVDMQSNVATGSLMDAAGAPLLGAEVQLNMKPLDGSGLIAEYMIQFTVPSRAVRSDVGFRVNTECGCQGDADFYLYEVRYAEGTSDINLIPNGDFSAGMNRWGAWGNGTVRLETTEDGRALHVMAGPGHDAAINSSAFLVTPGATYTLTFVAQISPSAAGSGYFDITFQDQNGEFAREKIMLTSADMAIGSFTTNADGTYTAELPTLGAGNQLLYATFAGSEIYWPAYASQTVLSQ